MPPKGSIKDWIRQQKLAAKAAQASEAVEGAGGDALSRTCFFLQGRDAANRLHSERIARNASPLLSPAGLSHLQPTSTMI
jgi:hypothetical protein